MCYPISNRMYPNLKNTMLYLLIVFGFFSRLDSEAYELLHLGRKKKKFKFSRKCIWVKMEFSYLWPFRWCIHHRLPRCILAYLWWLWNPDGGLPLSFPTVKVLFDTSSHSGNNVDSIWQVNYFTGKEVNCHPTSFQMLQVVNLEKKGMGQFIRIWCD